MMHDQNTQSNINYITPGEVDIMIYNNSFPTNIGEYKVDINFHSEVTAQISIKIDKIQAI